tara:strand:+ start:1537 stop:1707 length:171 start_codon:yes stop_codon:yes gene_type:complete
MNNPYKELTEEEFQSCVADANFQCGMAYDGRIPDGAVERSIEYNCLALIREKAAKK